MKCPYINPTIHQCENCPLPDCINDVVTPEEHKASIERDKKADIILSDDARKRWAQLNPERNRENKHRHYLKNKERYLEQHKLYHQQHREELNRKRKEKYQANREYELARQKAHKRERQAG
jgi:hypothetical protein